MLQPFVAALLLSAVPPDPGDAAEDSQALETVTVTGRRVANLQPASSYGSSATALRFDPQVDLQARGLPEGQADITVRGGLFENTGFRIGAVTIIDPQTGHYAIEIPLDPAMLTAPRLATDADHGLNSFNASVATVNYGFASIRDGGNMTAGAGTDGLLFASVRTAGTRPTRDGGTLGAVVSASASRGDGTLPDGDHEFRRFSGHVQWLGDTAETNVMLGYHDKFAGWPGMYTGIASLPETDHTKLLLALADHRRNTRNGWWEVGLALRNLENDYDFDRRTQESGTPGSFEHETRSVSIALAGMQRAAGLDWHFSGQFTADRLLRSTDLTEGDFGSRSYGMLAVAPEARWQLASGSAFTLRAGLRADFSNRDENAFSPLLRLSLERADGPAVQSFDVEYSRTSQLPGYTALKSRPDGLFGGNPNLGREYADTLKLGYSLETRNSTLRASVFHRRDDGLVDWTYVSGAPYARQANPVDIGVTGLETLAGWRNERLEIVAGYTWLDKDADYGQAEVDASYYALNYARHRLTLAAVWRPVQAVTVRLDNAWRVHEDNALRNGSGSSFLSSVSLTWQPGAWPRARLALVADNLTDCDFEEFPGTPPMGRQASLGFSLDW